MLGKREAKDLISGVSIAAGEESIYRERVQFSEEPPITIVTFPMRDRSYVAMGLINR